MADWYQIENSSFTVQINSAGAEIKRLFAKSWNRELLWTPKEEAAKKIWNRSSPVLFPIVGKLKDNQYHYQGKTYQMPQHGFARDLEFKCLECGTSEINFLLEADQESFKLYPFCFELHVNYKLDDKKLIITYAVKNVDRQDIYFSIGAHPAFETGVLGDYEIRFEKEEKGYYGLNKSLVNWKQMNPFATNQIIPTAKLFANDALIFKDLKSRYVDLINHKRHEVIRLNGINTPYFAIWGKESVPFICLEPWFGVSDDEAHGQSLEAKVGIQKLLMGASFNFSYEIELLT